MVTDLIYCIVTYIWVYQYWKRKVRFWISLHSKMLADECEYAGVGM